MADWTPEREVSLPAAAAAIVRHLPRLAGAEPRLVGRGWDNLVFELGDVYVRVAVRAVADAISRREARLLPSLADLPLDVPRLVCAGEAEPGLPGCWMVVRPVSGVELARHTASRHGLSDPRPLARFLATLHEAARAEAVSGLGLPRDPLERSVPAALAARIRRWSGRAREAGLDVPQSVIDAVLHATDAGMPQAPVALVHGDLHLRHVLLEGDDAVSGIIDWGDACLAPPVADLGVLWWGVAPGGREAFLHAYGPVDEATLQAARRFAVFSCLALWVAAHDQHDDGLALAARSALDRALAPDLQRT